VAVGAEQNALRSLDAQPLDRASDSPNAQAKRLRRGIDVMELQRSGMARVPAQHTGASGLGDEQLLDLAPPAGDSFTATLGAAKPSFGCNRDMASHPVLAAREFNLVLASVSHLSQRFATLRMVGFQPVPLQPLLCSRIADSETSCNGFDRQACLDQRLQFRLAESDAPLSLSDCHERIISFSADRKLQRSVTRSRARCGQCVRRGRRARG